MDLYGQIGKGSTSSADVTIPEKIGASNTWSLIALGYSHTCGINAGEFYCWGSDDTGQIGNGSASSANVTIPEKIGTSNSWSQIAVGYSHTCGINAGELYCWGSDVTGQIGNGSASSADVTLPEKIGTSNSWLQIALGYSHTCGINAGELYCWGWDVTGQIGNGSASSADVTLPEKIGTSNSWSQIALGDFHTCGINAGELYCWGSDLHGQIGNGSASSADVTLPEKIGTSNSWSQIALGRTHTCGINEGELYCWGRDLYGQIGNGSASSADVTQPEKIGASNTWSQIALGDFHTCGINSGELYCWGRDFYGQIGNGSTSSADVTLPGKIGTSNSWSRIALGGRHTCGINAGELYCFGSNSSGQTKYKTITNVPALVIER